MNYEWRDDALFVLEGEPAWTGGANWTGHTPTSVANFQVVMSELVDPDAFDVFSFVPTVTYDPDPTVPPGVLDGQNFVYAGNEVFFAGEKLAEFSLAGNGSLLITFTANSAVTDYGIAAGFLVNDIHYTNTRDLAAGEPMTQQLLVRFLDAGTVVAQDVRTVDVTGTEPPPPPGDVIDGTKRRDALAGLDGDDTIAGGGGADSIEGGSGNDRLSGGRGKDKFVFGLDTSAGEVDVILDFNRRQDKIVLRPGVTVADSTVADVDGDGLADTAVTLSTGAQVQLLGVAVPDIQAVVEFLV